MSSDNRLSKRRTVLKALGSGLIVSSMAGPASARSDALARELNDVRKATRRYRDVSTARSDGYDGQISPYVPGMGFHFIDPARIASDASEYVDVTNPPMLVYVPTGSYTPDPGDVHDEERDDDLRLAAVEFAHFETGVPGNYFSDETSTRSLKTMEAEGWGPIPNTPLHALHVWVHRNNPDGVFHPTNRTVA